MFVPVDQYYPPCKPKKENLDLFIPQGALKANWMVKQLEVVPSVLCFFVSLEFDDPNMSSKLQEIKDGVKLHFIFSRSETKVSFLMSFLRHCGKTSKSQNWIFCECPYKSGRPALLFV